MILLAILLYVLGGHNAFYSYGNYLAEEEQEVDGEIKLLVPIYALWGLTIIWPLVEVWSIIRSTLLRKDS